ncbi:hypothetical protein CesoFtcFv8_023759 [Champsocephalus esox]|uniref:X-ray repair complementing defective repair in Chinese hamster cells 4 n=1 Tax=Champsocephalus esox TaxID=159716 RepID=A0AAN8GDJ9_9TELE|nr:hypothetical protein CesoFtcFv8_023759 [Champsocephalus esox]
MHVSVREVCIPSEPDSAYFLRVAWKGRGLESGFQLLLTDGQDAWKGDVSEASVCAEAEDLEMQMERYVQDLHQALTDTTSSFSFNLTPSPPKHTSTLTLAYEKVQKDISFRLGSAVLKADPDPAEALRELLTHSLQRGNQLKEENQNLKEENLKMRGEHQRISAELKRNAAGKESLEAELYSRFVLVVNEKKAKIRSLQEAVTHLQGDSSKEQKKQEAVKSADEDEYGGSTDEEEQQEVKRTPPSTSSTHELDDSLKDITDVAPCRKRRFRHLGPSNPAVKRGNPQCSQTEKTKR